MGNRKIEILRNREVHVARHGQQGDRDTWKTGGQRDTGNKKIEIHGE